MGEFKEKFSKDIEDFKDTNKYNIDAKSDKNIEEEPIRNIILERLRKKKIFIFGPKLRKKNVDVQEEGGDGDDYDDNDDDDNDDEYVEYIKSGGFLKYSKNSFLNLMRSYGIIFYF